jgi:rhamnulokinase
MPGHSSDSTVLAFDLGATSGRAMLGRIAGAKLELREIHRFANEPVRYNGELHWDAPRLWHEIQAGLRSAAAAGAQPASIGVDTWGVDYALLGEGGVLLENPYHYRDSRTQGMVEKAAAAVGADYIYDITGTQFMALNTLYQLYAASQRTPRLLALAESLVTMPDLLNFWLTGEVRCEYTMATTTQFLDRRTRTWSTELLNRLGIPVHFLKALIEPGTVLGGLRREVASAAGLGAVPVTAPACHDPGSAVAAVRTGGATAFLSSGTWSLLGTEVPAPIVSAESRRLNFTNEGGVGKTCRLLKNITGMWLLESCKKVWDRGGERYSYAELLSLAETEPALESLIDPAHPAFTAPDDMPAAIAHYCQASGQRVPQTPGAFTRTILESLALKYRAVLEQLGAVTGVRYTTLHVMGGGCRNALLNRYTADATGCRVLAGPVEATALGNVAMQLVGIGAVGSVDDARDLIARSFPAETFEPSSRGNWDTAFDRFGKLPAA